MNLKPSRNAVLVVAGEASADIHGAKVVSYLKQLVPDVGSFGLGGEYLLNEGLVPVAGTCSIDVVGITEAIKQLKQVRSTYQNILEEVTLKRPKVALLLDLPDFNLHLARRLKQMGVGVVYYIAPQAWAWRRGRVRKIRKRVDKLCVVFPFEQAFFENAGVAVEYVGHPLTEYVGSNTKSDPYKVALVPGSRPREIERMLPAMVEAARILKGKLPELRFVLPIAPGIDRSDIERRLKNKAVEVFLINGGARAALEGARAALVTSGTATLEAALSKVPMVMVYRVSRLTHMIAKLLYRLPHVCIVNILLREELVPELLQDRVRPDLMAKMLMDLLVDGPKRTNMLDGFQKVTNQLGTEKPSQRVAEILAGMLDR